MAGFLPRNLLLMIGIISLGACLSTSTLRAEMIYQWVNYPALQNGYSIVGTITTDGSAGRLLGSAFESWSYTVTGTTNPSSGTVSWTAADGIPGSSAAFFQYGDGAIYADPNGLYIVGPSPWTVFAGDNAPNLDYQGFFYGGDGFLWQFPCPWNGPELVVDNSTAPTFLIATPISEPSTATLVIVFAIIALASGGWRRRRHLFAR
jgi:hypothetical protein